VIEAAPELGQSFGEHNMGVGRIRVDLGQATGVHHCDIRAQALTDVLIGRVQLVREEFQGQQHPE